MLSPFLLPVLAAHADTAVTSYALKEQLQLAGYLPPPPQANSAMARADLKGVLDVQKGRTAEQTRRVQAHDLWEDNVFPFARDILGDAFDKERLPLTRQFFLRVQENLVEVLMPARKYFARPRPYEQEPTVKPVLPPPEGNSYPSGHSMDSYLNATLLSIAVPEKHGELFARAKSHADSRVLAGVHYPSDLQGGQIAAAALVAALLADSK